jgi:hypothetical protein
VKRYLERRNTRFEHAEEIKRVFGLSDFFAHETELVRWVDARAWNSGDGPTVIFHDAVRWLWEHDVLLPGITTLTRLVARAREEATGRLWDTLYEALSFEQRFALDPLLEVPEGARISELERWRTGPSRASGPEMVKALDLAAEIIGAGLGMVEREVVVPQRRLAELARRPRQTVGGGNGGRPRISAGGPGRVLRWLRQWRRRSAVGRSPGL